jgi:hypothetical protein
MTEKEEKRLQNPSGNDECEQETKQNKQEMMN